VVASTLPPAVAKVQVLTQVAPLRERVVELEAAEQKSRVLFQQLLVAAARSGDAWTVEALLQHTSLPVDYVALNDGATLLYIASKSGHVGVVDYLLDSGAEVDRATAKEGEEGMTALYIASYYGHVGVVGVLLGNGAEVDKACTDDVTTPLHVAAQDGHLEVVTLLLDRGANVNAACAADRSTPLHMAVEGGHVEVVKTLLERGVEVGGALQVATQNGHQAIMEILTRHTAGN